MSEAQAATAADLSKVGQLAALDAELEAAFAPLDESPDTAAELGVEEPQAREDTSEGARERREAEEDTSGDGAAQDTGDGEDREEAERAASDIYGEKVPLSVKGKRREVTIGELKNLGEEYLHRIDDFKEAEANAESVRALQNELLNERQRMADWLALEGKPMTPEIRAEIDRMRGEMRQREGQRVIEWRPQWRDPDVYTRDREAIMRRGAEYGYSSQELEQIMDSRMVRWIWDSINDRAKLSDGAKALKRLDEPPGDKPGRQPPPRRKPSAADIVAKGRKTKHRGEKYAAIGALLEEL